MPRNLNITKDIEFTGDASHKANVLGTMQEKKIHFHDHFTDDTLATDKWLATVSNHTIAVNHSTYRHCCLITTDTTDNEASYLATPLCWEDDLNVVVETKVLMSDISETMFGLFLTDATTETSPAVPIDYSGGTLATDAANAVGIIADGDDTVNGEGSIVGVNVKASVLGTAIDSGTDWADAVWHTLRIELDPDGDATFYLDGVAFGYTATALTSGTALCVMLCVANRGSAAETVYVDRVDAWQDEET